MASVFASNDNRHINSNFKKSSAIKTRATSPSVDMIRPAQKNIRGSVLRIIMDYAAFYARKQKF